MRALVMPVGPDWYGVAMTSVREVVDRPRLTALPTAPDNVVGLFNLRGEIVPLFDTAALLEVGQVGKGDFVAIVQTALGLAGLAATGMPESLELGEPFGASEMAIGIATYRVGARLVTLIDVELLLAPAHVGGVVE